MTNKPATRRRSLSSMLLVAVVLGGYGIAEHLGWFDPHVPGIGAGTAPDSAPTASGTRAILEAFAAHRSDVAVEVGGVVDRVLPDDDEGDRHQRFVLRLDGSEHTVLVAHNIDLADRVPLAVGDRVELRGEYEWNDRGGVVHWTHHDPRGRHTDGFVRHRGRTYR